jgi:hypothetical protein
MDEPMSSVRPAYIIAKQLGRGFLEALEQRRPHQISPTASDVSDALPWAFMCRTAGCFGCPNRWHRVHFMTGWRTNGHRLYHVIYKATDQMGGRPVPVEEHDVDLPTYEEWLKNFTDEMRMKSWKGYLQEVLSTGKDPIRYFWTFLPFKRHEKWMIQFQEETSEDRLRFIGAHPESKYFRFYKAETDHLKLPPEVRKWFSLQLDPSGSVYATTTSASSAKRNCGKDLLIEENRLTFTVNVPFEDTAKNEEELKQRARDALEQLK